MQFRVPCTVTGVYWLLWSVFQQYLLKLTPFSKCKFHAFLHWHELTHPVTQEITQVCSLPRCEYTLTEWSEFQWYCWYTLYRSPCTAINPTGNPNLSIFENPFLKGIYDNWKIIRRWKIKLIPVKYYTFLLSTFEVWKSPDHYINSY